MGRALTVPPVVSYGIVNFFLCAFSAIIISF